MPRKLPGNKVGGIDKCPLRSNSSIYVWLGSNNNERIWLPSGLQMGQSPLPIQFAEADSWLFQVNIPFGEESIREAAQASDLPSGDQQG